MQTRSLQTTQRDETRIEHCFRGSESGGAIVTVTTKSPA